MTIVRKTVVDQIEINRTGNVSIRLGLLIVEDGEEVDCKYHRTVLEPGTAAADQFALVNEHLANLGKPEVSAEDIAKVEDARVQFGQLLASESKSKV